MSRFGINDAPQFLSSHSTRGRSINDLPEGPLRIPGTEIDAAQLDPGMRRAAGVFTARQDAMGLRLQRWRFAAQPGF